MSHSSSFRSYGSLSVFLVFSACQAPKLPPSSEILRSALPAETELASQWSEATANSEAVVDDWLSELEIPEMVEYIRRVLEKNRSLEASWHRVEAAAAVVRQIGGRFYPQVSAGARGLALSTYEGGSRQSESFGAMGAFSWEIDLWGRLGSLQSAAESAYFAKEAEYGHARFSLAGFAAKSWLDAVEARQLRDYALEVLEVQEKTLAIVRLKVEAGAQTEKELRLSESKVSAAQARLAHLEQQFAVSRRILNVLEGRYPNGQGKLSTESLIELRAVPAGLPSALLERRYDVVAARHAVEAAFYMVAEAQRARLPSLNITGQAGQTTSELLELLNANDGYWVGSAGLTAPLFTFGQLKEQVVIRTAEQAEAVARYGEVVLRAFAEVENTLTNGVF